MPVESITEKVIRWDREETRFFYGAIHESIENRARRHFNTYLPTLLDSPFPIRLRDWINNCTSEVQQKLLFRLIPHLFYVSSEEFSALYTAAYRGPVVKWMLASDNISAIDPKILTKLQQAEKQTWFCPITDSMQISAFYHINNISGELRPDWRSIVSFGTTPKRIVQYMNEHDIKRVVLLEDFVGSGSQCKSTLEFLKKFDSSIPFLFIPLIICEKGLTACRKLIEKHSNIVIAPIITLKKGVLLNGHNTPVAPPNDPTLFQEAQKILRALLPSVRGKGNRPTNAFGFQGVGTLLVTYANCPNNTPPLFHYHSPRTKWKPLFKRSRRA